MLSNRTPQTGQSLDNRKALLMCLRAASPVASGFLAKAPFCFQDGALLLLLPEGPMVCPYIKQEGKAKEAPFNLNSLLNGFISCWCYGFNPGPGPCEACTLLQSCTPKSHSQALLSFRRVETSWQVPSLSSTPQHHCKALRNLNYGGDTYSNYIGSPRLL